VEVHWAFFQLERDSMSSSERRSCWSNRSVSALEKSVGGAAREVWRARRSA